MERMIPVSELKKSVSNVRKGHSKEDIAMMANSITHRGIINPPTVAKNGDGKYEIIAGNLRVAGAIAAEVEEIRCFDATALTPAERVALSLAENVDRRQMSAIELYRAFAKLFKAGVTVPNIAEQFKVSERRVQQLLAIGTLPEKILKLAEQGEIGDTTLEALAIAPAKDVVRYTKLKPEERPSDWGIKAWLQGKKGWFPVANAIFDLEEYVGPKVTDLFAEDYEYLADGDEAWRLQNKAIDEEVAKLKQLGWDVTKLDFFNPWQYDKTSKANGGKVYYTVTAAGKVDWHKGYAPKKQAGKEPTADKAEAATKPEISKAMQEWMDEQRFAAVAHHLIATPKDALAPIVMLLMTEADNIQFRYQGCPIKSDAALTSYNQSEDVTAVEDAWHEMLGELNIMDQTGKYSWNKEALLSHLKLKTPAKLLKYLAITVAHNWARGGNEPMLAIAKNLGIKQVNLWEHDEAFWNSIKNKQTLLQIAKDEKIKVNENATANSLRQAIRSKISDSWRPKWLKF